MKRALDISTSSGSLVLSAPIAASRAPSRLADLCSLTKPRMNLLVLATTAVGYYMALPRWTSWTPLIHLLLGTALTAAAASVLNQYLERNHDRLMPRTRNRPLPAGRILPTEALLLGIILAITGALYLSLAVNLLTAALGLFTLLSYIFLYTPLKRITSLNTVVGAIPGAIPPVMGFTAVNGALSIQAIVLFGILFLWQMPHFLAIAILYCNDYAAGGFKMLPVIDKDLSVTSRQILLYSLALVPVTLLPVALNMAGAAYFCTATLLGMAFFTFGINVAATKSRDDAKRLFIASIIYLPILLTTLMLNKTSLFELMN
ncbi:MAG TPA: heme o synthase [Tepidisphaeraceae bacterium]|nr:heme o synthase [Tepidisphaeraceae bacterium]